MEMKANFKVIRAAGSSYATYEEAEAEAKRYVGRNQEDYAVYALVAVAMQPLPAVEIVKVS